MVFFTIGSIYLNGTNYNKLLLNYGENLRGNLRDKLMGKIYGENLWEKLMGKINGEK